MSRAMFGLIGFAALALLGALLAPAPATADQGEHLYEWSGGRSRDSSYRSGYGAASYRTRSYDSTPAPSTVPGSSPNGATVSQGVSISVSVPANAEIWFGDDKTVQTGAFRQFVSPALTPGHEYFYEVKARWTKDGKEVTGRRRITVHAGDVINVAFDPVVLVTTTR